MGNGGVGIGPAIFAGVTEGAVRGVELGMKYQQMKTMQDYTRYRALTKAVDGFMAQGAGRVPTAGAPQTPPPGADAADGGLGVRTAPAMEAPDMPDLSNVSAMSLGGQ